MMGPWVNVRGANYEPNETMMKTHPFAAFIYSVEDTLGLWCKARKEEQISKSPFDAHCEHFQSIDQSRCDIDDYLPRIKEIFKRLHVGCNLSPEMFYNHINILESIYVCLARQPNVVEYYVSDPIRYYIEAALIPLICTDIFIFKENAGENSIYFHLDRIMEINDIIKIDGEKSQLNKRATKKYISNYIKGKFEDSFKKDNTENNPELLMPEILGYIEELPKKGNQTCASLNQKIHITINRLSNHNNEELIFKINSIAAAYTAIIILQDVSNKTDMFHKFIHVYKHISKGDDELLDNLKLSMYHALNDNYSDISLNELFVSNYFGYSCKKLLSDKSNVNTGKVAACIFKLLGTDFLYYLELTFQEFHAISMQGRYLSKMVSYPPQFDIPMVIRNKILYSKYKKNAASVNVIVFNKINVSSIISLTASQTEPFAVFYSQYKPLIEALDFIQNNKPDAALKIIKNVDRSKLPLFGHIKYSLAVLQIGLMYKFNRSGIKHLSLMQHVNNIINHQGIVAITVIRPHHITTTNCISWLSESDYSKHSIVMGNNTYNKIISQAIYSYNFTIARHTTTNNLVVDEDDCNINRVNILNVNYRSQLINHDLLERLNLISGKILANLNKANTNSTPDAFVRDLIKTKTVSMADVTDDLIHCIAGSSLGVCLLDSLTIILLFSVPGDDVGNIAALGENTKVVELLFRAYQHNSPSK